MKELFVVLVCAHILGDFLFQTDWIAKRKHRLDVLFLHVLIHGVLVYGVLAQWTLWWVPVSVVIGHGILDLIKRRLPDTAAMFTLDQALHVVFLFVLAGILDLYRIVPGVWDAFIYRPLVWIAGFVAVVRASGFAVAKVADDLIRENGLEVDGLKSGGRLIGQLERTLIFLLILIGQPAGIGFLVAAKSILRFEEAKKQQLAEYVLIGTLLSFSLAIALTFLTIKASRLLG